MSSFELKAALRRYEETESLIYELEGREFEAHNDKDR